jgi:hypothetical protein
LRSSSRDSEDGLRAIRVRAPRRISSASGRVRVPRRRGEQGGGEAPVLLARRVHERRALRAWPAARRVREQPEQPLRLRPALHGVLLVQLARVLGEPPDPASAWSRRPELRSASAAA